MGSRAAAGTVLTVTLNLALDVTYHVDRVVWHGTNRVTAVAARAGGKGVNVARVLHGLGRDALVTGLAGGPTGDAARQDLRIAGLPDALVGVAAETRRTLTVVDVERGDATGFWEPGPLVTADEWEAFLATYERLLAGTAVVVMSGSLPDGVPRDAYRVLCESARAAGVPAVLDADGDALRLGLPGAPALVKPNIDELRAVTDETDPAAAADALRTAGADAVVVSRGPDGLVASTPAGRFSATPPEGVAGNPTGAGDAAVAALAAGMLARSPWPERLAEAVALSAAAVAAPLAGSFNVGVYRRYLPQVDVQAWPATSPSG